MGVKAATELMLSGKHLSAKAGLAAGLVDKLVEGEDAQAAGLAYANELLAAKAAAPHPRHRNHRQGHGPGRPADAGAGHRQEGARPVLAAEDHRMRAGRRELPFDEGMPSERALFAECLTARSVPA
jgi:3-hydroxyacyl-CoA dehydrogenase